MLRTGRFRQEARPAGPAPDCHSTVALQDGPAVWLCPREGGGGSERVLVPLLLPTPTADTDRSSRARRELRARDQMGCVAVLRADHHALVTVMRGERACQAATTPNNRC